ncbi:MAG TPA: hypothetical protein VMV29_22150, partial [Ktedonobacterales bacterium]|nr:hypothetical protein [Ktedonobacterales bacterium]
RSITPSCFPSLIISPPRRSQRSYPSQACDEHNRNGYTTGLPYWVMGAAHAAYAPHTDAADKSAR